MASNNEHLLWQVLEARRRRWPDKATLFLGKGLDELLEFLVSTIEVERVVRQNFPDGLQLLSGEPVKTGRQRQFLTSLHRHLSHDLVDRLLLLLHGRALVPVDGYERTVHVLR